MTEGVSELLHGFDAAQVAGIGAGGSMTDTLAQGLLEMANGHFIKGIAAMLKK